MPRKSPLLIPMEVVIANREEAEPHSPKRVRNLDNLVDELEYADLSNVDKVWKLLQRCEYNGSTVVIQRVPYQLLQECLDRKAYRAARFLIQDGEVAMLDACKALQSICAAPYPFPDKKLALVHLLLEHKTIPDYKDERGYTALKLAYENKARIDLLTLLASVTEQKERNALLHLAVADNKDKIVRMLLQQGADPNQIDAQGRPPLVVAAHLPTDACLQVLLRHGANVNGINKDGRTVLALTENPAAAMVLLRRGARSDTNDQDGVTPLHTALNLWCRWRRGENLAVLLFSHPKQQQDQGQPQQQQQDNAALLDLLVDQASDINVCDVHGRTILHYAAEVRHTPAPEYVQALVMQKGASMNARDKNGWTPLHTAVAFGNYATAAMLVELGAHLTARDAMERTPLHVMGLDNVAVTRLPQLELPHAIRLLAFGPEAPLPPYVVPHHHSPSDEEDDDQDDTHHEDDDLEAPLIQKFLMRGFDFRATDRLNNLPFFYATDNTLHYLMVHAAACQGMFG
eukprot:scaffold8601_cov191-Amphora_coffeaeformis.AAC.4